MRYKSSQMTAAVTGVATPLALARPGSKRRRVSTAARASQSAPGIEAVSGVRPEVDAAISAALGNCLTQTDLGVGNKYTVRTNEQITYLNASLYV
jgi:hypothetical protein